MPEPPRTPYYMSYTVAFDASLYRSYDPKTDRGQQLLNPGGLARQRSLHTFLGDGLGGEAVPVGGDLTYWLNTLDGWSFESEPGAAQPRIQRRFRTQGFGSEMRLHVTLSADHDYLPSLIETYWCDTKTRCEEFKVEQFQRAGPEGVWVPVRAWHTGYYRKAVYPAGVSEESYRTMTPAAKKSVDPLITFEARRLGPPHLFVIDPATVKINEPLPDSVFVLDFPEKSIVFDQKSQKALFGGKYPIPERNEKSVRASRRGFWSDKGLLFWVGFGMNACAAVAIVVIVIRRRRRRRPAPAELTPRGGDSA
jgi:hypothetical protein